MPRVLIFVQKKTLKNKIKAFSLLFYVPTLRQEIALCVKMGEPDAIRINSAFDLTLTCINKRI